MTSCRLCGEQRKLVKAHIVPEAFARVLRVDGETPLLISDTLNTFPKKSPIGVYDEGILCDRCEPQFSRVDDYGIQILLKQFRDMFMVVNEAEKTVAFRASGVDQEMLLRFFIATLWRASVSTQLFYRRVNLGPYEGLARRAIINPSLPISDVFAVVLTCWVASEQHISLTTGLMNPFRENWDGVNAYRMYFGEVVAYIKVDKRPFGSPLKEYILLGGEQVTIIARNFDESKDFQSMIHTAQKSQQNQQNARQLRNR
jgi:hypothetical protein